jgi:outer membrane protein assembly factor BamB
MKPSFAIIVLSILIVFASGYVAADGQAWKFRADRANSGVYIDGGTRPDGTLLWKYSTGHTVRSSPAVVDNVVYFGSNDGHLYALNALTGGLIWNSTAGKRIQSSPAVADGVVYAGSWDSNVYAFDASTGSLLWNYTTGDAVISSPSVDDGLVYIGSFDGNLYALEAASGNSIWVFPTTGPRVTSSPAVSDGVVYAGSEDGNLYALNSETGALLWNYTAGGPIHSSPSVTGGIVYVGSDDHNLYALNASTGALLWTCTTGDTVRSSPAVVDGVVYVGSYDDHVYALNASTGTPLWSYRTGGDVDSSPAVADGVVYVGSLGYEKSFHALDAATGTLLWDYSMGDWFVYSSPAVSHGMVYVGCDDGNLYAFGATPGDLPAFDDFDDNMCNSTIWDITGYGGPYTNETNQRLEITVPSDSSADTFSAGYASKCALRGDFDIQVDYHLIAWPPENGVRVGLLIERQPSTCTIERVSYTSPDVSTPGDHYATNFAGSVLLSATHDTDGRIRLVRTGSTIEGYYFDEVTGNWKLLQSLPDRAIASRDVTFTIRAWGHGHSSGDKLVKVAFDNFVINKGEVIYPGPTTGVTNLRNTTYQPNLIRWSWNDPGSIDFDHVMVYLDGVFGQNVTAGTETWTATGLTPSTAYTIGTRIVGSGGLVNETWVNQTASTSPLSIARLDPPAVDAGSPGFPLNVSGTGYRGSCSVLWNGDELPTQFIDTGHLSTFVPGGMIPYPAFVNITVHDSSTGATSNPVFFSVRDSTSGATAWKFRSDSSNSGVYDDGGTRPGNELLWKYMTESYYGSCPVVVDGVVYICGVFDINAIDALTGRLLWTSPDGGGMSSPAVAGNVVYVGSSDYNVSALDTSTGALLWKFRTGSAVYSSPALYNGTVYAGSWDDNLYALDAATGTLLWSYPTGGEVRSSPAVAYGTVYFGSNDHNVYALDATTGTLLWKYSTGGGMLFSSPAVADGVVYIQSNDGKLHALDSTTGAQLWDYPVTGYGDSCPAVANGVVYIGSDDGNLYALDAMTGGLLWSYATGGLVRSSPSVANGVVYVGNNAGTIHALEAGTGAVLWTCTTDERGFSGPAIAGGIVYVQGYNGDLYALTTLPEGPPRSVTDLHATTVHGAEITWAWTDPATPGFSHVMVYLDGVFQENVTAGTETWTATGLSPSTSHTIGTRTVSRKGAISPVPVTSTATTGTLSISHLDPAGVVEDDPAFTLNVYGTGFTPACSILWNGGEQSTRYLEPGYITMEVPAEFVAHSGRVTITVHDPASGESSNPVIMRVTDNPATAKARKFRSDLNNSGVYDDGGRRPVPTLLWTYRTGAPVTSSPSVVDGTVYVGSQDRNLYALNASTGALLWKYDTRERYDYVSSSPAVSNGVVYIGGMKTKVHAVDAYSGDLLWEYKLPRRTTIRSGISSSAAVAGGVVSIGNMDGTVYAFDEETGVLLWNHTFSPLEYDENSVFSSPAVADGVVYIQAYGGHLCALDASGGTVLWNYVNENDWSAYSSPAVSEGVVYFGSGVKGNLHALHAATGAEIWEYPTGASVTSSPAVSGGVVYFGCNDNNTYALDASSGALLWNFTTGWRVSSSPAVASGVVYIGSLDNTTYALDAATGALLWTFDVGGRVMSSPAVSNGVVYIGSGDGSVYAIGSLPLDPPVAGFTANVTSGTAPLGVAFTDMSGGVVTTRFWDFGDGTTAWANETLAVSHTYSFPGTFSVTLTAGNRDAQDTETKTGYIQVTPSGSPAVAWFTASPMAGTAPLVVRFTDRSRGAPAAWEWDFGDGNTSTEQNPVHTYAATGKYTPRLTVSNSGGTTSYSSFVWVMARPVIPTFTPPPTFTPKPTIPPRPGYPPIAFFAMDRILGSAPLTVHFTDMSFNSPASWQWDFGDGHTSTLPDPVNTFSEAGIYPVSLTVKNAFGQSTTSRRVYVR